MRLRHWRALSITLVVLTCWAGPAGADPILVNGNFEAPRSGTFAGLEGWTVLNLGQGTWIQATQATIVGASPPPPEGMFAAIAAQGGEGGPGSHVLFQDFLVPTDLVHAELGFDLFIRNSASAFATPPSLDFRVVPNQQARVDIITTLADPFSVAEGDVLLNLYQTRVGDPLVSGYTPLNFDLTAFLLGHTGQTLRLRFAETDNQFFFTMGVDRVNLDASVIPEPGTLALVVSGVAILARCHQRRRTDRRRAE